MTALPLYSVIATCRISPDQIERKLERKFNLANHALRVGVSYLSSSTAYNPSERLVELKGQIYDFDDARWAIALTELGRALADAY
jgi:hypothetical protein